MDNKIRTRADRLAARRHLKLVMAKAAIAMSCIAVFCVVYFLVTPGVTAEWPLQCGLEEHIHDESCYEEQLVQPDPELICGLEEGGHVHDESCYTMVQGDLICEEEGTEEAPHEHDDSCYEWTQELTCDLEEGGHVHDESCYAEPGEPHLEQILICGKQEHTHSDGCYIVPEEQETYYCGYLTEHTHNESCYFENGELKCNIPEHLHTEECLEAPETISLDEHFQYQTDFSIIDFYITGKASYSAAPDTQPEGDPVEENPVEDTPVEENPVEESPVEDAPVEENPVEADPVESKPTEDAAESNAPVETEAPAEDVSAEESQPSALEFNVTISEDQSEYDAYEALISEGGDVLAMEILNFSLRYEGAELDLSNCEVHAELTPTELLLDYAENSAELATMALAAESETEEGTETTGATESTEDAPAIGLLLAASGSTDDSYEAAPVTAGAGTVTVPITGNTLRTATMTGENPKFTVQYYAMLSRVTQQNPGSGYTPLSVINTSNNSAPTQNEDGQVAGIGGKGRLPYNGTGDTYPYLVNLYLGSDGRLATTTALTKIYNDEAFQYFTAPGLQYFNVVINNTESNYNTFEIWVLKEGKDSNSLSKDDWDVYQYDAKATRFTNRPESVQPGNGYILIEDGTVIRLVYTPAVASTNYDARFYDYDISNGTHATTSNLMSTTQYGINTPIGGSGTQLTFGNGNAGVNTTLSKAHWTDNRGVSNMPNQMNRVNGWGTATVGYGGCTYGLVTGYDAQNEDVILAPGLKSNSLFGTSSNSKAGKYIDPNINKLSFSRIGDTYTLTGVPGTNAQNLDVFRSASNKWTNLFWPMDNATTAGAAGHDLKFGGNTAKYHNTTGSVLPTSDDLIEHNSYFGMHFGVSFELTKNYVGPLEYYFFGDDDMWVFLEHPDGHSELICDLGGVHTSVGEYVNLWDYIDPSVLNGLQKDEETGKEETALYKLKFFYTERGASGSTCWMQFTLPTAVGLDLEEYLEKQVTETTGALRIEKQLDGVENSQSFEFRLDLSDLAADNYMVRGANGELLTGENALAYIGSGDHFKLQAGDVLLIKGLPQDTSYKITELTTTGYHTEIVTSVDGVDLKTEQGVETSGTIQVNKTTKVVYTNQASYELPATGGGGTIPLYTLGGVLILFALVLMHNKKNRRKGDCAC